MARKNLDNVQPIELTVESDKPMASSLQVAKHFGKAHDNILRDIENLKKDVPTEWFAANFEDIRIISDLGHAKRKDPAYMMTRDGFTFMAMGFTGKRVAKWKIDYLNAFNAMEAALIRAQGKPAPLRLPPETEEQRRERGLIVIKALLKFWATNDGIPVGIATKTLCSALSIGSLDEFTLEHFSQAWGFILRAFFMPSGFDEMRPENQDSGKNMLHSIEEMFDALMQFKGSRSVDGWRIFQDACSLTPELFLKAEVSKMPMIIWGVFQFWYGYTVSSLRSQSGN